MEHPRSTDRELGVIMAKNTRNRRAPRGGRGRPRFEAHQARECSMGERCEADWLVKGRSASGVRMSRGGVKSFLAVPRISFGGRGHAPPIPVIAHRLAVTVPLAGDAW